MFQFLIFLSNRMATTNRLEMIHAAINRMYLAAGHPPMALSFVVDNSRYGRVLCVRGQGGYRDSLIIAISL